MGGCVVESRQGRRLKSQLIEKANPNGGDDEVKVALAWKVAKSLIYDGKLRPKLSRQVASTNHHRWPKLIIMPPTSAGTLRRQKLHVEEEGFSFVNRNSDNTLFCFFDKYVYPAAMLAKATAECIKLPRLLGL